MGIKKPKKYVSSFVYNPSEDSYVFLRNIQTEYGLKKVRVGLGRIIDLVISKYKKIIGEGGDGGIL